LHLRLSDKPTHLNIIGKVPTLQGDRPDTMRRLQVRVGDHIAADVDYSLGRGRVEVPLTLPRGGQGVAALEVRLSGGPSCLERLQAVRRPQ
jgi:hypothetical protein